MSELNREEKQRIIDEHEGVLNVVPFKVWANDADTSMELVHLVSITTYKDGKVYDCVDKEGNIGTYEFCTLPKEKIMRPMTAEEIAMLPRGTAFVGRSTLYNPLIIEDEYGDIYIGIENLSSGYYKGYRLPGDVDIRPFTIEVFE